MSKGIIGSDNGLAPKMRQAIIWADGLLIHASLGRNELKNIIIKTDDGNYQTKDQIRLWFNEIVRVYYLLV